MKKFTLEILVEDDIGGQGFLMAFDEVAAVLRYGLCREKYNASFTEHNKDFMARWSMKEVKT